MCNLYSLTTNHEAVRALFKVSDNRAARHESLPAIFPGHSAPVVRYAEYGERELVPMSWGFVLPQKGKSAKRITNARDDNVRDSRFWSKSFEERRCLVPVSSFSEPKGKSPAVWHWFALDDERTPFAFAGLWRSFKGRLKPDGDVVEMETYSFLTTSPNDVVKPIHPNRMPVMLADEDAMDLWLAGSADDAFKLAKPFPADRMTIVNKGEKKDEP